MERWQTNKIALETGALTVDEVREQEGYGPLPEGPEASNDASDTPKPNGAATDMSVTAQPQ
jgi:hypothetical protein